jgi:hypothetical protein
MFALKHREKENKREDIRASKTRIRSLKQREKLLAWGIKISENKKKNIAIKIIEMVRRLKQLVL